MPVRPPIHRPVGRRDKRERDRDADRNRDPAVRALYKSARWQRARQMFLARHPCRAGPDQPPLGLLDPQHPVEGLLEPGDGCRRRPDAHRLRFHGGDLAGAAQYLRPAAEMPPCLHRRQLAQGAERLLEMIGHVIGGPGLVLRHATPPFVSIAQSRMAMASASLSSAGLKPRARAASIIACFGALPLPVAWRLMVPTGTPA